MASSKVDTARMDPAVTERLLQIINGSADEPRLAEAALLIACDEYPCLDVEDYLRRLDRFAETLRPRLPSPAAPEDVVVVLNEFLFLEQGFAGNLDDYYDPRNSFLNEVLDRKLGIPITLSILYIEVGRRLGLPLVGVAFPGHFLVKFATDEGDVVLDPFCGGLPLGEDDLVERLEEAAGRNPVPPAALAQALAEADAKETVLRMLRNLKGIYLQRRDFAKALAAMDRILSVAPDQALELRDRGAVYEKLECFRPALDDYQRYLACAADASDAAELRRHVVSLQQRVARLN